MSYIRGISNPEGMYAYAAYDVVYIHHSVKPPLSSKWKDNTPPCIQVPIDTFEAVCEKWDSMGETDVSYKGLSVSEELMDFDGQKRMFVRFQYKKKFFYMWGVTWAYVCNNVVARLQLRKTK